MTVCDVVVIGGGAAGLMCAAEAGKRGRSVYVIEHSREIGRKILISGGGRCNFTNFYCRPENFLSANPHFAKSALARYPPSDFIRLVESHRIPYHEKKLGQLFCDGSAREIVDLLLKECASARVRVMPGTRVIEVRNPGPFVVETSIGTLRATSVVIATGGLSIPKIGATAFGYEIAARFGLKLEPCRPALVPLLFDKNDRSRFNGLAGVSTEVVASLGVQSFREKMLFTHRGLSGPAILQISSYWDAKRPISIDLLPGANLVEEWRARGNRVELKTVLAARLPRRLAERWLELTGADRPEAIEEGLHAWTIRPGGTEGYEKAEVTAGGVSTAELSSQTMETRSIRGLYFIGEVVDVTGHLGGFNFQWAWASGWCAGQVA